jgi:RimJ/RimL family protein N-acetyltransferase
MAQEVLHSDRLHLRPLSPTDFDALHSIWGDPQVIWWGHHRTLGETRSFISNALNRPRPDGAGWWMLVHRESGEVVGDGVLQPVPRPSEEIEVGWHLARSHWGQGYATEAGARLVAHAFDMLGLEVVVADIAQGNERSIAVAERLGMTRRPGTIQRAGLPHWVWEIRPARG